MMVRRGAALLLVLAMTLIVGVSVVGIARAATLHAQAESSLKLSEVAPMVLDAVDSAIVHWLATEEYEVVLPRDVDEPSVEVRRDQIVVAGRALSVSVTGWDQSGMVPLVLVDRLRPDLRGAADLVAGERGNAPSLAGVAQDMPFHHRVFPTSDCRNGHAADPLMAHLVPIGARLATHPRDDSGNGRRRVISINTRTAPIELIREAAAEMGVTVDPVFAARANGRVSATTLTGSIGDHKVRLAPNSDAWALRVDVRYESAMISWWLVYERAGDGWRKVQAVPIDG